MAVMYPSDIENYTYTASEKELYLALKSQLPDKYHVFYSVRWFDNVDNKRIDSESDFIVFDPSFGFLTIEVKGGTGIEVNGDNWTLIENYPGQPESTRRLNCSPYDQAEKSMRHFYDYFYEEFNQSFNGVYGFAVAFPRFAVVDRGIHAIVPELTIDINDMSQLHKKINSIFHYWKGKRNLAAPFSATQRTRFISLINKRVSLSAAAGALIPIKEKEIQKISFVQDSILDLLFNYKQARIIGGAGTGKTHIGIKKCIRDAISSKKVLFTCCSKQLIEYAKSFIPEELHVECMDYETLMKFYLGDKYEKTDKNSLGYSLCFEILSSINIDKKFDTIVIDEAQDFDIDMGMSIRTLLKNENESSIYVFYDKNQNLFMQDFEDAFGITSEPFILRYNIRNTASIYNYAVEYTQLGKDTIANSLVGFKPEIQKPRSVEQALKTVTNIVNRLTLKENVPVESIVILTNEEFDNCILKNQTKIGNFEIAFEKESGKILVSSVASFKGLESDVIIYINETYRDLPNDSIKICNNYVALTRARYYLYVVNIEK